VNDAGAESGVEVECLSGALSLGGGLLSGSTETAVRSLPAVGESLRNA
jgi:hypothetical protein